MEKMRSQYSSNEIKQGEVMPPKGEFADQNVRGEVKATIEGEISGLETLQYEVSNVLEAVKETKTTSSLISKEDAQALHKQFEDRYRKFSLGQLFEEANPDQRMKYDNLVSDVGDLINQLDDQIALMEAGDAMNKAASMEIDQ